MPVDPRRAFPACAPLPREAGERRLGRSPSRSGSGSEVRPALPHHPSSRGEGYSETPTTPSPLRGGVRGRGTAALSHVDGFRSSEKQTRAIPITCAKDDPSYSSLCPHISTLRHNHPQQLACGNGCARPASRQVWRRSVCPAVLWAAPPRGFPRALAASPGTPRAGRSNGSTPAAHGSASLYLEFDDATPCAASRTAPASIRSAGTLSHVGSGRHG